RIDAERLDVDALRVHLGNAPRAHLGDAGSAALVRLDLESHDLQRLGNHAVRVHVDRPHAASADADFAARCSRARLTRTRRTAAAAALRAFSCAASSISQLVNSIGGTPPSLLTFGCIPYIVLSSSMW